MNIQPYAASSPIEIDNLLAEARVQAMTFAAVQQWALRSIPDLQLRQYCLNQARQFLAS